MSSLSRSDSAFDPVADLLVRDVPDRRASGAIDHDVPPRPAPMGPAPIPSPTVRPGHAGAEAPVGASTVSPGLSPADAVPAYMPGTGGLAGVDPAAAAPREPAGLREEAPRFGDVRESDGAGAVEGGGSVRWLILAAIAVAILAAAFVALG